MRLQAVRLWSCAAERFSGCDFALWGCDVWRCEVGRLSGCETMRLWDCETMIWDYETMIWYTIEAMGLWTFRGGVAFSLIRSFTFPSFKNSQITLDNLAWSAIGRDLTSQREKGVKVKGKMFMRGDRTSVK